MKEPKDNLQPETIDQVIDGEELSPPNHLTTQMLQQLHLYSQGSVQENERSLDSIWQRLSQSREHAIMLPDQWKSSDEQPLILTRRPERKVTPVRKSSWKMRPSFSFSQSGRRHPLIGVVSIGLIAAVAVMTISSFAVFSHMLHLVSLTASQKTSTSIKAQPVLHTAKQVCSVSPSQQPAPEKLPEVPSLDWSSQGQIALSIFSNIETFSAQNCTIMSVQSITNAYASWSPDGQKLAVVDLRDASLEVQDRQETVLLNLSLTKLNVVSIDAMVWSADSQYLTVIAANENKRESIMRVNVASDTGTRSVTTATVSQMAIPFDSYNFLFSPDGTMLAALPYLSSDITTDNLELWNVESGKMIQSIPLGKQNVYAQAFSPDGSLLALGTVGGSNQIQIYATTSGKLVSTFNDPDFTVQDQKSLLESTNLTNQDSYPGLSIKNIAWSPDGKYLAESSRAIHIYAIQTQKIVTTFDKVDDQHWINALTWSPDSQGLVSTITSVNSTDSLDQIDIWQLN